MGAVLALGLSLILAAVVLVVAVLIGPNVRKIVLIPGVLEIKPPRTPRERALALVAAVVCLVPGLALAYVGLGPWPPPPPSPTPSIAPTESPQTAPPSPSAAAAESPSPTPGPPDWATPKVADLASRQIQLGSAVGEELEAEDGWLAQGFENGILFREPDGSVWAIVDPIYPRWRDFQSTTQRPENLGFPVEDQSSDDPTSASQRFETGTIQCAPDGCFHLYGEVRRQWANYRTQLGPPIGEIRINLQTFTTIGDFANGRVFVNVQGETTICGNDGSTIKAGPTLCGPSEVQP